MFIGNGKMILRGTEEGRRGRRRRRMRSVRRKRRRKEKDGRGSEERKGSLKGEQRRCLGCCRTGGRRA